VVCEEDCEDHRFGFGWGCEVSSFGCVAAAEIHHLFEDGSVLYAEYVLEPFPSLELFFEHDSV